MHPRRKLIYLVFVTVVFTVSVAQTETGVDGPVTQRILKANETDAFEEFPTLNVTSGVILKSAKTPFPNQRKIMKISDVSNSLLEFPKQIRVNNGANWTDSSNVPQITTTEDEELKDLITHKDRHNISSTDVLPDTIHSTSINTEVEQIENGDNTEETRIKHHIEHISESSPRGASLFQGQIAAILAGLFAVISIIAYMGLLYWRRYLENRYGSRTMLVNDEFYDPDGMRNFSI